MWGALAGLALTGLGGLFGNKNKQTQTTNSTSTNQSNFTNQGNNTYYGQNRASYANPLSQDFNYNLLNYANNRLGQGVVDPQRYAQGITTQNIQNINNQELLQRKVMDNVMRQRGLQYSPMGATLGANAAANATMQKFQQINNVPALERQTMMENENLLNNRQQLAQALLNAQLVNQENEGFQNTWQSGNQSGTQTQQSNSTMTGGNGGGLGGMFQAMAPMAAYYGAYGWNPINGGGNGINQNLYLPNRNVGQTALPSYMQYWNPYYGGGQ